VVGGLPEAHKTTAKTFFSVGILLLLMIFWSLAHEDRNSTIVGGGVVDKPVKIRLPELPNELCETAFMEARQDLVKLVFGGR